GCAGRGATVRRQGPQGRRSRLQAHEPAALPPRLVSAVGSGGRVPVPDLLPLDGLQGTAGPRYTGDGAGVCDRMAPGAHGALPARRYRGSGVADRLGPLPAISAAPVPPPLVR